MESEFWKQFAGGIARQVITVIAGALIGSLVANGLLTSEQAKYLLSESSIAALAGFLLLAISAGWLYLKTKYNINVTQAAKAAPTDATLAEIKEVALGKEKTQTSI